MAKAKNFLCKMYDTCLSKVKGLQPLKEGEHLGTIWKFGDRPAHAGQVYSKKVLPNGSVKQRLLTVFAGKGKPMILDTCITKNGKVLSASSGYLNPAIDVDMVNVTRKLADQPTILPMGTMRYASTTTGDSLKEVRNASNVFYKSNPSARRLFMGGDLKV